MSAWVDPPAGESVTEVVALVGLTPALAHDAPGFVPVTVPVAQNAERPFWGGPAVDGVVVSFFCRLSSSGWVPGPVVGGLSLLPSWSAQFPWLKPWLVARLQEIEAQSPALVDRKVEIRGAFPRDAHGRPAISVTYDAAPPSASLLGSLSSKANRSRAWSITLSAVAWCDEPETRDRLSVWLANAMALVLELCPLVGIAEPSVSLEESEDFQTLGVPTFLASARLSGAAWSSVSLPRPSWVGHLTV